MIKFDSRHFRRMQFSEDQLARYRAAAKRDLEIAVGSEIPEVIFRFSYDALIKLGIYLIAKESLKVRSVAGHHIKIMEVLAEFTGDEDFSGIANEMRLKRNRDLYDGGVLVTLKDSETYREFVIKTFQERGIS